MSKILLFQLLKCEDTSNIFGVLNGCPDKTSMNVQFWSVIATISRPNNESINQENDLSNWSFEHDDFA